MSDVAFLLEEPQHATDRRIARLIWKVGEDIRGSRTFATHQDVHDLSLAATELGEWLDHMMLVGQHGAHTLAPVLWRVKRAITEPLRRPALSYLSCCIEYCMDMRQTIALLALLSSVTGAQE